MGVQFAKPGRNDAIVAVARNPEKEVEEAVEAAETAAEVSTSGTDAGPDVTDGAPMAHDGARITAGDEGVTAGGTTGADVANGRDDAVPSDDDD
jgi:DNA gyrase subunit A